MFDNLAQKLFGAKRAESDSVLSDAGTNTIHGTAVTDSSNGSVMVELSSDVTNPDPIEVDGETFYEDADTSVELPTTQNVKEGDEVLVSVLGNTPMRSPVVTGVVGSGDRIAADATAAREIAEATGQHFWDDDAGAHVTELTREEWEQQQAGPNSLWNSLGMLFRNGLTNLLAILTNGLAIYDGQGNADENIVARFTASLVRIGKLITGPSSYDNEAAVEFFDENTSLWVQQYANVDHSTIWRTTGLSNALTDADGYETRGRIAESSSVDSATGTTAEVIVGASVRKELGSNVGSRIKVYSGKNYGSRYIELVSDNIVLDGSGADYLRAGFTMQHVIDMLTTASAALTRSSATSSWASGEVKRSGKVVTVTVVGAKLAAALASGSNSAAITTIPAGFRPTMLQRVPCALSANGNYANVWAAIGTGGAIVIGNHSAISIPTTSEVSLNCTYIID